MASARKVSRPYKREEGELLDMEIRRKNKAGADHAMPDAAMARFLRQGQGMPLKYADPALPSDTA